MKPSPARAFTLIELLVVVGIMGLLAAVSLPALQSMNGTGKFNQAVSGIAGLCELARSQAIAQNTYTWVVLYENNPASNTPSDTNSGPEVYAAAYLSNDGTDPFNWTGTATLPAGTVSGATTTLTPIARFLDYKQTGLIIANSGTPALPNIASATSPAFLASTPNFQYPNFKTGNGTASLSSTSSHVYGVVQFTPSGAARNASSPVESIWFGLYPVKGKNTTSPNVASLKINGLTGLVTVYRP